MLEGSNVFFKLPHLLSLSASYDGNAAEWRHRVGYVLEWWQCCLNIKINAVVENKCHYYMMKYTFLANKRLFNVGINDVYWILKYFEMNKTIKGSFE